MSNIQKISLVLLFCWIVPNLQSTEWSRQMGKNDVSYCLKQYCVSQGAFWTTQQDVNFSNPFALAIMIKEQSSQKFVESFKTLNLLAEKEWGINVRLWPEYTTLEEQLQNTNIDDRTQKLKAKEDELLTIQRERYHQYAKKLAGEYNAISNRL